MPRVKSNVARLKRKKKVMKLAKGYFGGRSKLWKAAKESVERAAKYAYRDRRRKKGIEAGLASRGRELKLATGAASDIVLIMPGCDAWQGGPHFVTQVVDDIFEIFHELSFTRAVGLEAETVRYGSYALYVPHDH